MTVQMVTPDSDKLTLREHRLNSGMSQAELALKAGINADTVRKAESTTHPYRTNLGSAYAMTGALGIEIGDVRWLRGVSDIGRPAGTGCPLTVVPDAPAALVCGTCYMELPATGICDDCS